MNDLADLLRESAASAPDDRLDTDTLLVGGRRRVRRRRLGVVAGTALATAAVVTAGTVVQEEPITVDAAVSAPAEAPAASAPSTEGENR